MSVVRIANPDQIRPSHVVLVGLVYVILLGGCLLTCGAASEAVPDGGLRWAQDSLFRAVVDLLNLNNTQPTFNGVEIKSLVFHVGAALAILVLGVAIAIRPRRGDEASSADTVVEVEPERDETLSVRSVVRQQISSLAAAQVLMLLYVAWSFASAVWSRAPDFALAGSALLAMELMWAFALGLGLNRTAARRAGYALVVAGAATAVMAVLYHIERNPTLRASYPIGNPTVLAACLIPGLVLGVCMVWSGVQEVARRRRYRWLVVSLVVVVCALVMGWAFWESRSRGPAVGLALGMAGVLFFALGRKGKTFVIAAAVLAVLVGGTHLFLQRDAFSPTGRSASMRVRLYGWSYATELARHHIVNGYGQGGFVLNGDALAVDDVLDDPEALQDPIRHAHNEYLHVWADLGSIGVVLLVGGLVLTLAAAARAVPTLPSRSHRWMLIGLSAALVGLMVEETGGVGLRMTGVPMVFYTVLGLVWALSSPRTPARTVVFEKTAARRWVSFSVAIVAGIGVTSLALSDFRAARSLYEVRRSLEGLEWDMARYQADYAYAHRLMPLRRLMALDARCETRLHIARFFKASALRRIELARMADPSRRQPLVASAAEDAARARRAVAEGHAILEAWYNKAPDCWNASRLRGRLRQVEAELALLENDERTAAQYAEAAGRALERELRRRPFDPTIALHYVMATEGRLELDKAFELLARPLRYHKAPPDYFEFIAHLAQMRWFQDQFAEIQSSALTGADAERVDDWPTPFLPERIVLCGIVAVTRDAYVQAEMLLARAARLYEGLPAKAPAATASCYALLADTRFFKAPDDPERAIDAAEAAVKWAPASHIGRQIVSAVRYRLITYHLAIGHEDFVRDRLLPPLMTSSKPKAIDREVASQYIQMCDTFLWEGASALPAKFEAWLERAVELDPNAPEPWVMRAELAFRAGDDQGCVGHLVRALRTGAAPEAILSVIDGMLARRPDTAPLRVFRQELLGGGVPSPVMPATLPSSDRPPVEPSVPEDVGTTGV